MKVVSLKDWCDSNINAMAWQRLGLELYDELSALSDDFDFDQLDDPQKDDQLSVEAFDLFAKKIVEIYSIEVAMEMIKN